MKRQEQLEKSRAITRYEDREQIHLVRGVSPRSPKQTSTPIHAPTSPPTKVRLYFPHNPTPQPVPSLRYQEVGKKALHNRSNSSSNSKETGERSPYQYIPNSWLRMQLQPCNERVSCPVDCVVSDFSPWSACPVSCTSTGFSSSSSGGDGGNTTASELSVGAGWQYRHRVLVQPPVYSGKPCPPMEERQRCNDWRCPEDCIIGVWSAWSSCVPYSPDRSNARGVGDDAPPAGNNLQCVRGRRSRHRVPIVGAQYGGAECPRQADFSTCNAGKAGDAAIEVAVEGGLAQEGVRDTQTGTKAIVKVAVRGSNIPDVCKSFFVAIELEDKKEKLRLLPQQLRTAALLLYMVPYMAPHMVPYTIHSTII